MKSTQTKNQKAFNLKMVLMAVVMLLGFSVQKSQAQCSTSFAVTYDSSGTVVQFYDSSFSATGNPVSYTWSFGDGTFGYTSNPVHQYNFTGTATVCLTVVFSDSCSSTFCDSILTRASSSSCQAGFSYFSTPGTTIVDFTDGSVSNDPIASYAWDFGDGSVSSLQNPQYIYSSPGTYFVCLTITSTTGCSSTYCDYVNVATAGGCQAGFDAMSNGLNTINFADSSYSASGSIVGWSWSFGDSTYSNSQNPSHTYSVAGQYYVCLTITTSTGCSSTTCNMVTVGNFVSCQSFFYVYQNPANNSFDFYDASNVTSGTVSYSWDFGDGTTSTLANPNHVYVSAGVYNVCLTVSSTAGCSDTFCQYVTSSNSGVCNATFYSQVAGNQATFVNTAVSSSATFTWTYGDGGTFTGIGANNVSHQYAANGIYGVCLTVQDSGCTDTYCDSVIIGGHVACSASFAFIPDSTGGNAVQFIDLSTPTQTWLWSFGDGSSSTSQNPYHQYNSAGPYTVCLTISDSASGCSDTFCRVVSDSTACQPVFVVTPDTLNPAGVPMTFTTYSPCGVPSSIVWDFGDGTIDSSLTGSITHVYTTSGQYTVCVCEVIGVDTFCFCDTITAYRLGNGIEDPSLSYLNLAAYPNPFSSEMTVTYTLEHSAAVNVEVYTITGNRVKSTGATRQTAGKYTITVNGDDLSAGLYLLRISVDNQSVTQKISLQK